MKLKLMVSEYCLSEMEVNPPKFPELSFDDNCTIRKFYIDCLRRTMELECLSMIRGKKFHFELIAESKLCSIQEEQILKIA